MALANVLEGLQNVRALVVHGGIGVYGANAAHGPFLHVDTRPWRARW